MKKLLLTTICAAGLASGASAATVTFDFVALAAGNEGSIEGQTITIGGLGVTVTSSSNAYLDDLSAGGLPGGLGVCASLSGSGDCAISGTDEVDVMEFVTLSFDRLVDTVSGLSFTDGSHNDLNSSSSTLILSATTLNGPLGPVVSTFANAASLPGNFQGVGTSITFAHGGDAPEDFYLNAATFTFEDPAPVPLPAGLPLLAGALGMLAYARRKSA